VTPMNSCRSRKGKPGAAGDGQVGVRSGAGDVGGVEGVMGEEIPAVERFASVGGYCPMGGSEGAA
jgi:hypothetical protein